MLFYYFNRLYFTDDPSDVSIRDISPEIKNDHDPRPKSVQWLPLSEMDEHRKRHVNRKPDLEDIDPDQLSYENVADDNDDDRDQENAIMDRLNKIEED
jgi:hypothetical protein